ncbi:hypothetical protein [Photobacterium damselae]|uniref:hypothetical protein n=1 Tax=Photobacterium damselae TaxID=38293 RepID=UPI0010FF10AC|nr:hypothetical protein [Photobacterium damselae]TLS65100.1 hypothetical protein FD718_21360 [Photobacterium damselae subsp. damselae]
MTCTSAPLLTRSEFARAFRLTNRTVSNMIRDGLPIASGTGNINDPYRFDLYDSVLWMLNREAVKSNGKRIFTGFSYE